MTVAKPCMGGDETDVSLRRQIECLGREPLVWDKIINDSYKTMISGVLGSSPAGWRSTNSRPR
jgi:hypothetical protein